MTHFEKIQKSSNMVAIIQTILSDVWADYSVKFAKEFQPFVRNNEDQDSWISAVNSTFGDQIKNDRKILFDSIPVRFHITRLYKELSNRLNANQ
jgi:hypothetical protein